MERAVELKSVVVYASHFGNTQKVAQAVADGLRLHGSVKLLAAEGALPADVAGAELVVVGGPTEGHTLTPPLRAFLGRLAKGSLPGTAVAAFDTRVRWPRWLSGSAADGIAKQLAAAGGRLVAPPESFFVTGAGKESRIPLLEAGELERSRLWGATMATELARTPATAAASAAS